MEYSATDVQLQEEEREVLLSIYDGDEAFKQLSSDTFQYKYGENDDIKSFLVEIQWGPKYPTEKPSVNMETFYNKHVIESVKTRIKEFILSESEQYLGEAMTYTLFEGIKEKLAELLEDQPDSFVSDLTNTVEKINISENQELGKKMPKKEQLSKAQKRRAWDRADGGKGGEKPRGWDWVDIVKHLSQTGWKEAADASPST